MLKVEIQRESIREGLRTLDWAGFALIIGGTILFLYGLEMGATKTQPWSAPMVVCMMVFGILLLTSFMVWEARFAAKPIIPGRIFSKSTNMAAFVLACLHAFTVISYDFFLPLYSQIILGLTPLISGVTLFALVLPMSFMPIVGAFVIRRTGNYVYPCYVGAIFMTLGSGLFISFKTEREWAKVISFQIIAGFGAGLLFQSPMIALQNFLHQSDMAAAMSAFSFLRSLCTSISVVIGSVLIQHSLDGGSITSLHGNGEAAQDTSEHAYMTGLRNMWTFYCAVCGLMLASTAFIKQKRKTTTITNEKKPQPTQSTTCKASPHETSSASDVKEIP